MVCRGAARNGKPWVWSRSARMGITVSPQFIVVCFFHPIQAFISPTSRRKLYHVRKSRRRHPLLTNIVYLIWWVPVVLRMVVIRCCHVLDDLLVWQRPLVDGTVIRIIQRARVTRERSQSIDFFGIPNSRFCFLFCQNPRPWRTFFSFSMSASESSGHCYCGS